MAWRAKPFGRKRRLHQPAVVQALIARKPTPIGIKNGS
jgi:hypothetical protein